MVNRSEQRHEPRHKGRLPVELGAGKGTTRDFSSSGIYFETNRTFALGQPIEFNILLKRVDPEQAVRVKCQGKILRVEDNGSMMGVAAAIDSYKFVAVH